MATTATPAMLAACGGGSWLAPGGLGGPRTPKAPALEIVGDTAITLTEGTNLAMALSPDGKQIAMDLQGILWILSIEGGQARQLTGYFDDIGRPHWSPDGQTIAFQSYRSGNFHVWTIRADGTDLTQITTGAYDHREPRFSPDGKEIVCASDRSGSYAIYVVNLASGDVRQVADTPDEDGEPVWSPDGQHIAFSAGGRILVVASDGASKPEVIVASGSNSAPAWTRDGRGLVYCVTTNGATQLVRSGTPISQEGEDVFRFPVAWLSDTEYVYTADGAIKRATVAGGGRAIPFAAQVMVVGPQTYTKRRRDFDSTQDRAAKGIASPQISPDETRAVFVALNQVWLVELSSGELTRLTQDGYYKCHPAWSSDGVRLVYSTDRGGKLDLWEMQLDSRAERQITRTSFPCVSARWSPDDSQLACLDNNGNVLIVNVADGSTRKLIGPLFTPGRPTWSPDGATIALSAIKPYSARYPRRHQCGADRKGRFRCGTLRGGAARSLPGAARGRRPDLDRARSVGVRDGEYPLDDGSRCLRRQGGRPQAHQR